MALNIAIALCGGLMFGVSVPVLFAAWGNGAVVVSLAITMLLCGGALVVSIGHARKKLQGALLLLNALISLVILIGISLTNQHPFLIIWSVTVLLLAVTCLWRLRHRKII